MYFFWAFHLLASPTLTRCLSLSLSPSTFILPLHRWIHSLIHSIKLFLMTDHPRVHHLMSTTPLTPSASRVMRPVNFFHTFPSPSSPLSSISSAVFLTNSFFFSSSSSISLSQFTPLVFHPSINPGRRPHLLHPPHCLLSPSPPYTSPYNF